MGRPLSVYFASMRLAPLIALTFGLLLPASSALTQDAPGGINPSFPPPKNVLELFTSQGCDTCPPADQVLATAEKTGAIPYDIPGVKFSHVGEKCSFDAFIAEYKLDAPGLDKLADIVRGADTSRLDLTPQSAGLFAISLGLSHVYADDHEMLKHGMVMYDALYAWCRHLVGETHAWPPKMS